MLALGCILISSLLPLMKRVSMYFIISLLRPHKHTYIDRAKDFKIGEGGKIIKIACNACIQRYYLHALHDDYNL